MSCILFINFNLVSYFNHLYLYEQPNTQLATAASQLQLNCCKLTFYKGTKIGNGRPVLTAKIGTAGPILAAKVVRGRVIDSILSMVGLKPDRVIRVIRVNRITFCPGQASTKFLKYPGLTRILHWITCINIGVCARPK